MITEIVYIIHQEAYKIYLRPTMAQAIDNIQKTWGHRWDKIEHERVSGGIPQKWIELPGMYTNKADAIAAQKVF